MKKPLIIAALVAAPLIIAPYFIGSEVETEFRRQLDIAGKSADYSITINDYQRGWFSSTATLDINFPVPATEPLQADELVTIKMIQEMQHGPVLWTAGSLGLGLADSQLEFELPEDIQQQLAEYENISDDTLTIEGRTYFDLSNHITAKLRPFSLQENGATISVAQGLAEINSDKNGHISGTLNWQGIKVENTEQSLFHFAEMTVTLDQHLFSGELYSPNALYEGDINMTIAKLEFVADNPAENFSAETIKFSANSEMEEQNTQVFMSLSADTFTTLGASFSHFVYDLSLENLDTQVLKDLNQTFVAAQDPAQTDPMAQLAELQALLPRFVEKNPQLKINKLGMTTEQGDISSNWQLSIDKELFDPQQPQSLYTSLNGKGNGEAPAAFFAAMGLAPMVDALVEQKFLRREEQNLIVDFSYAKGQASLNGSPVPLGF